MTADKKFRKRALIALALAFPLVLTSCTADDEPAASAPAAASGGGGDGYGYTFAAVTHGAAGDAFWSVVKSGVEKAAADQGVQVEYQSDGDPQKQAQLIDAAVNQKVDGLIVSMANPDALKASVQKAVAAGIPVITINSGQDRSAEFGAMAHVGQDEQVAGEAAGQRLRQAGVSKLLCVIHEAGNVGLEQRCSAAKAGLGATAENLQVDNNNLTGAQSTIKAKLQQDSSIDGVLTLGGQMAGVAANAIKESGSTARLATFDLNSDVAKLVQDGSVAFAVDQQPYTQGYLPVVMLTLYRSNLNTIGGGQPVLTGPSFVTKENAAQILQLADKGTR
ncbi:simple sugar transport system substrate-binding protein [Thermocatellispora tengchongensis]|uniref:Simple sugar transport system substrate-binding protein n=1 Tax=Thermocatellispora tengchongensis TaxID=1073253 RepID=A0A840PJ75_9ACTN|nr:sugar ABC transporter substrate-binding protein [Thermocatellispora tengchongensis]MBB5139172.1 simple sugar transport system substrate-binding protein [Thermocatellispora tengchongensis]